MYFFGHLRCNSSSSAFQRNILSPINHSPYNFCKSRGRTPLKLVMIYWLFHASKQGISMFEPVSFFQIFFSTPCQVFNLACLILAEKATKTFLKSLFSCLLKSKSGNLHVCVCSLNFFSKKTDLLRVNIFRTGFTTLIR